MLTSISPMLEVLGLKMVEFASQSVSLVLSTFLKVSGVIPDSLKMPRPNMRSMYFVICELVPVGEPFLNILHSLTIVMICYSCCCNQIYNQIYFQSSFS